MRVMKITEEWLRASGFKWSQIERQPSKHWLLWIGLACVNSRSAMSPEDLGIELAQGDGEYWYCWLRADYCGRYARFLHVRHLYDTLEVEEIIKALTGREFNPGDCFYGSFRSPEEAATLRRESDRIDCKLARSFGESNDRRTGADPAKIGIVQ